MPFPGTDLFVISMPFVVKHMCFMCKHGNMLPYCKVIAACSLFVISSYVAE